MSDNKPVQLAFSFYEPDNGVLEKVPIIFLHGVTASKECWEEIPQTVANHTGRKVYSLDARNHGHSEWSEVFNFDVNVNDLLHFLDKISAQKVIIVGHSMGGVTAIKTALKAPERVQKLVVEDMTVKKLSQDIINLGNMYLSIGKIAIKKIPSGIDIQEAKRLMADIMYSSLPDNIKALVAPQSIYPLIVIKQNQDGSYSFLSNVDVLERTMKDAVSLQPTNIKGVFEGPACFIYGVKSPFCVKQDEHLIKEYFPEAEFIGIENASHSVHSDCTEEFNDALIKFLKE